MITLLIRLLAITALLVMPFGMSAPAAAQHHAPASEGHCNDNPPSERPDNALPKAHCAAACTALPAQPEALQSVAAARSATPAIASLYGLMGEQPETATPPPRLS